MKRLAIIILFAAAVPVAAVARDRDILWRVVQTCVATHSLTGVSFPCLAVETTGGIERGYAVVRAPFAVTHLVVTPTVRTSGIEATRLRTADAPNYFADAWASRHFVVDALAHRPETTDLALAVNSRPGRSQDQLHIHVDCIRRDVTRTLAAQSKRIRAGSWTPIAVLPGGPRYSVTALGEADLANTNVFALVQKGLNIDPGDMDEMTVVVVGASLGDGRGFYVLARHRIPNGRDEAHGEALMDHACSAFG